MPNTPTNFNNLNSSYSSSFSTSRDRGATRGSTWIGADDYGQAVRDFVKKDGTITFGTFYSPPALSLQVDIARQVTEDTRIIVQKPYSDYNLSEFKPIAQAFHKMLDVKGVQKTTTLIQQHSKTLIKEIDGEEVLFLGTGNFTEGAMKSDPRRDRSGTILNKIQQQISQFPGDSMSQINFGVMINDQDQIKEYKQLMNNAAMGKYSPSSENFIIGGPTGRSAEAILGHLDTATKSVDIMSPYMDSSNMANKIEELVDRGIQTRIVTTPLHSQYAKGTGGNPEARSKLLARAIRSGAQVYMTDPESSILLHAKAISVDGALSIVGSHNFTNKAEDRSIEASYVSNDGQRVTDEIDRLIQDGVVLSWDHISNNRSHTDKMQGRESTVKQIQRQIKILDFQEKGLGNEQYAHILADEDTYFTLPASLGASAFHGANLEHNLMEQNNYLNLSRQTHYKGTAESIMEYNAYMLKGERLGSVETFLARSYDSGLQSAGVGNWLNREIFIPRGWGRVYKDEKGAIASIAGIAGKILDESYLYYANVNPDWMLIGRDMSSGVGYGSLENPMQGIFQTSFENIAGFAESMAQSLGMYLAITAPMEMMAAGVAKDALEKSIKGTLIDNTLLSSVDRYGRKGGSVAMGVGNWAAQFMGEFYFGELGINAVDEPGGLAAQVLKKRFDLDNKHGSSKAFFDHNDGPRTGYHAMQMVARGRARYVLEGTFQPFLIDYVNPFDASAKPDRMLNSPTGARRGNAYDEFNLKVKKLIDVISQPVDMKFRITPGRRYQIGTVEVVVDDAADVLTHHTHKTGGLVVKVDGTTTSVESYVRLKELYEENSTAITKKAVQNNEELHKLLTNNGFTELESKEIIANGKTSKGRTVSDHSAVKNSKVDREIDVLYRRRKAYAAARSQLDNQLGNVADKLEVYTTGTGMKYKTQIASALQDVIDMIPLNPLKWGLASGGSAQYADEFMSIGQLFSFQHAAEFTQEALSGQNAITRVFLEFEPTVPEQVVDGKMITKFQHMSNVVKSRITSADRIAGAAWDSIKKFITQGPLKEGDLAYHTQKMREAERRIVDATRNSAKQAAKEAGKSATEVDKAWRSAKGFRLSAAEEAVDAAEVMAELKVSDVDEAADLMDEVLDYTYAIRRAGGKTVNGITATQMAQAIGNQKLVNLSNEIFNVSNKFSGNVKAEKFLKGATAPIAALIFASVALNNIMQSTQGVSIAAQLGLSFFGEDEDIAVRFEGNRFLPTEFLATAFGIDQTAVNLVADSVVIGGSYALGNKIAKSMTTKGYLPYTFDAETIYKLAEAEGYEVVDAANNRVTRDFLEKMTAQGAENTVTLRKTVGNVVKETLLTKAAAGAAGGFRSEKILQEFAENVPTKAFIFGAIAMLALEGLRQTAGTLLQAMAESPDDKNYFGIMGALTVGGFIGGAGFDKIHRPALDSSEAVLKAGGQVAAKTQMRTLFKTNAMRWAVGGAALGAAIYVTKLVLDPNIKQKGSLDPLVAGAAFGIGTAIFKKSMALGAIVGLGAGVAMAALNWAGIRVLEVGRAGAEVDPHTSKLVAQLSQYSTAVLEEEKDSAAFHMMMAAYASQFSAGKNIIARDENKIAGETQVVAKQAPLPFMQFFVAERVKGPRGTGWTGGLDTDRTVRTYSLGIQSGALFGTSLSVELPVAYTPGEGFFGFTYNSENNIMAVPNFTLKVGVWAAASMSTVGIMYKGGAALSSMAYNMTGLKAFKTGAANFGNHADDLFDGARFVFNAAEKITSFYMRQTLSIFATLQGTDVRMAYDLISTDTEKVASAVSSLEDMSIEDITKGTNDGVDTLNDVSRRKQAYKNLNSKGAMTAMRRGKSLFIGAVVGAIAASLVHEVVKNHEIESSHRAGTEYVDLDAMEDMIEKRKTMYVVTGAILGAIGNDIRSSRGYISNSVTTAVKKTRTYRSLRASKMARKTSRVMRKFAQAADARKSAVLNNKIVQAITSKAKWITSSKAGILGSVFFAAMAFNYIKTKSEFGITTMMDRHIVYDKNGNAYKDYELQTEHSRIHQIAVAGSMAVLQTGVIGLSAAPHINQRETMLGVVRRKLDHVANKTNRTFLQKIRRGAGKIMGLHHWRAERETGALLKSLLSLDDEAVLYEAYTNEVTKARAAKGPMPILDPKLQKIEDVLKLRQNLGKEELKEFLELDKKVKARAKLSTKEASSYQKFLTNAEGLLSQADELQHLSRGFRQTAKFRSFGKRATAALLLLGAVNFGIRTVANQGGIVGEDTYLDRLYNRANEGARFGQRGPDGKKGTFIDGAFQVAADVMRLITKRDIVNLNYAVDSLNGKVVKATGQRLVGNAQSAREAQRTLKDLSEMLIVDNPNAYIATFDFGGKTIRNGDRGMTTSTYFQLQGPAQDISTATYSMAAKFIFNQYTAGKGRLATIVDRGLRDFKPEDPGSYAKAALAIRNATSMMHGMKTSRKYSAATGETASAFMGDSMAAMIVASRQEALLHQAWQPVDSLFTNMFFETMDKAKHRNQDSALLKFFEGLARNEGDVLKIFGDLMSGGLFENFFRRTAISNVKFFSGSFGKPPKLSGPQNMVADVSTLWKQTHHISVQAEMFKQTKIDVLENFRDKTVAPMWNHGVLAIIPNELKLLGVATVALGLTAVMAMSIAQYTQTKTFYEQTGEMLEVFGRKEAITGPKIQMGPADTDELIQQVRESLHKGKKYDIKVKHATSSAAILSADPVRGAVIDTSTEIGVQSRNIGLLRVNQAGSTETIRVALSRYVNILDEGQLVDFVETLGKKGDQIRDMFAYFEESNGRQVRKSLAAALTGEENVQEFLRKTGVKNEQLYDVFTGKVSTMSKEVFVNKNVLDFQDKFAQGLDRMYDLGDDIKAQGASHHLFEEVEIEINGQTKKILKGELMYPESDLNLDESLDDATDGSGTMGRKSKLEQRLKNQKQAFLDEVETIVKEEMDKVEFPGRKPSPAEQAAAFNDARRSALHRIKTQLGNPDSAIGGAARGAGIVQPTTMVDQANAMSQAASSQATKVRHKAIDEAVDFFGDAFDSLHYSVPKGTVGIFDSLGAAGKGAMHAVGTAFDLMTGLDVLGAYMRVAETANSPFATDLDRKMAEKELGRAIMTSVVGLALGFTMGKFSSFMSGPAAKKFMTVKNVAIGAGVLTVGGVAAGMLNKSIIKPGVQRAKKFIRDNKVAAKIKSTWDTAWYNTADAVGHLAAAPVNFAYKHGGKEAAYGTAGFLGGFMAGGIIGIGAIGALKLGAAALGMGAAAAVGAIGALPLLVFSIGVGIVAGVAAIFMGDQISSALTYGTREFLKIPYIGQMAGLTDPYRQIRNQKRFQHHFVNSPFLLGYAGDIMNSNWMAVLGAAEDPTGRDQVSNLFGEVLSEGEGYGEAHSAWRRQAADGMIGRPKPIVDEVISQELKIRAEHYSDNVIGRYTWDQMVKYSDNSATIRRQEAQKRAERVRITEAARVRMIKAAMEAGGPTQAMKPGNSRTAAVTGVAAARVEQIYKDLDPSTASISVSAATVVTHKSNTKNSDQSQADTVKAQAVSQYGAGVAAISKDFTYKGRIYIDQAIATVEFSKEQSDMNPILTAEAEAIGANKAQPPGVESQVAAYNSYKDES